MPLYLWICRSCLYAKRATGFIASIPICMHCGGIAFPILDTDEKSLIDATSQPGRELAEIFGYSQEEIDALVLEAETDR